MKLEPRVRKLEQRRHPRQRCFVYYEGAETGTLDGKTFPVADWQRVRTPDDVEFMVCFREHRRKTEEI
jgi:hypothetical protein